MADIDLTLNMGLEGSLEAKRLVIHTIEQINQNRGMLGGAQRGKLAFLTREFNVGKLALPALEEALKSLGYGICRQA